MSDDTVVTRYKQAYQALHGKPCPYSFFGDNGWYRMRTSSGFLFKCAPARSILGWAIRLERRAKEKEKVDVCLACAVPGGCRPGHDARPDGCPARRGQTKRKCETG